MRALPVRLVLHRPRNPENAGAVARAMKNFGLRDWVLVDPRFAGFEDARKVAVHAEDLLGNARICASLDEAVQDCVLVAGTTSRTVPKRRRLSPRDLAALIRERGAAGTVALVFGDERWGLDNETLHQCDVVSTIPTSPEQPSVNLAQSVLLYAYEIALALAAPASAPRAPEAATEAEVVGVADSLETMLRRGGFLVREGGPGHALGDLVATLRRAHLTRNEARLWRSALGAVTRRLGT